jgi:molybdopterin-guanine dinucleotide biosynthesis protein A
MRWTTANFLEVRFVVSAAADTPFFPADLAARLSGGCGGHVDTIAIAASAAGTHPVFGLWPVGLADDLEQFLTAGDTRKILAFADRYRRVNVPFDDILLPDGGRVDPFFNVNTPADAARAETIAGVLEGRAH